MITIEPSLAWGLRIAMVVLIGLALLHKLRAPLEFRSAMQAYLRNTVLDKESIVSFLSLTVITLELAITFLVAVAWWPLVGAVALATLFLIYGVAMAANLLRGNALLDCGCSWGADRQPATWYRVWGNAGLSALSLLLAVPVVERPANNIDLFVAGAFAGFVIILYAISNQLMANSGRLEQKL
jgi:Methylamine utilisation protein MauE